MMLKNNLKSIKFFLVVFFLFASVKAIAKKNDTLIIKILKISKNDDYKMFHKALNSKGGSALKIIVGKGLYSLHSNLSTSRANTSIIFEKDAIIYFSNNKSSGFAVLHDNFTLTNGHIKGNGVSATDFYTGYGILLNGVSNCTIKKTTFENISGNNILFYPKSDNSGCNNNVISDNVFTNPVFDLGKNGDESVIMLGYSGANYCHNNNIIKNNIIDCDYKIKIGVGIIGHGKNNLIDCNQIRNCRNYGILAYESIDRDSTLINTIINKNIIKNIGEVGSKRTVKGMGIYLMKSIVSTVSDNKIFNILINSDQSETLGAGAISISGSPHSIVKNNLIDGSNMYGIVSDYSFESKFINNIVMNTRKSGAYFINMNNIIIQGNVFKNIGEVALKGYFENTSLPYIQEQMRTNQYKNIDTGNNFVISGNKFFTSNDVLFFTGNKENIFNKYPGNLIKNNIFEKNTIIGSNKKTEDLVVFRNNAIGSNKVRFNTVRK